MENSIAIVKEENIQQIVSGAPEAFKKNILSRDKCVAYGSQILETVSIQGMTDEIDKAAADYINKSRRTLSVMNEARTPLTKLFDEFRKQFTTLEKEVDPSNPESVPGKVQRLRDEYARKKHEQAEERRREEELKAQTEQAKNQYSFLVESEYRERFNKYMEFVIYGMNELFSSVNLSNYEESYNRIKSASVAISEATLSSRVFVSSHRIHSIQGFEEIASQIRAQIRAKLEPQFKEQYAFEIESNRDSIIERMPSKKKELEAMAVASEQEKQRMQEEMKRREAEEAARAEEERKKKEEEEKKRQEMEKQQKDMQSLFSVSSTAQAQQQTKTSIKKRIEINDARGFLEVINMWWLNEGCSLPLDELQKKFKSQITFCEKMANKDGKLIESPYIQYVDEVKAK